jgi:hypothetical protein
VDCEPLSTTLAWAGSARSGSGKTYNAGGGVERLLTAAPASSSSIRSASGGGCACSPTARAPSPFNVAIFGGPHGDLPLNEHAGA